MFVAVNDSVDAIDFRVEDVAINCEAMRCSVGVWWYSGTESENRDLFVRIIILKNITNRFDG